MFRQGNSRVWEIGSTWGGVADIFGVIKASVLRRAHIQQAGTTWGKRGHEISSEHIKKD